MEENRGKNATYPILGVQSLGKSPFADIGHRHHTIESIHEKEGRKRYKESAARFLSLNRKIPTRKRLIPRLLPSLWQRHLSADPINALLHPVPENGDERKFSHH